MASLFEAHDQSRSCRSDARPPRRKHPSRRGRGCGCAGGLAAQPCLNAERLPFLQAASGIAARSLVQPDVARADQLAGFGPLQAQVKGGTVGLIVDTRGRRPFVLPADRDERIGRLRAWNRALDAYPREV